MQLILVRHGEPVAAKAVPGEGGADPELSSRGRVQASAVGWWAANAGERDVVTEIVVSSMRRARETAVPAADALGLDPVVDPDLAEFDVERPEYRPVHERAGSSDPEWERILDGFLPEYVDVPAFLARVGGAVDRIVERARARAAAASDPAAASRTSVLVVCHAGVINTVLAVELGLARPLTFPLDHGGLTRILVGRDGRRRVRSVNETGHVADVL